MCPRNRDCAQGQLRSDLVVSDCLRLALIDALVRETCKGVLRLGKTGSCEVVTGITLPALAAGR